MRIIGDFDSACEHAVRYGTRHNRGLDGCTAFLTRCGWGNGLFGIESVSCAERSMEYINTGDTYSTTIIQEGNNLSVSSWGDWYEEVEREYCIANNAVRCGWCSDFTPIRNDEWSTTICEHCGNCVSG